MQCRLAGIRGVPVTADVSGIPVFNGNDTLVGYRGILCEYTQRPATRLEHAEEHLALEQSPVSVVIADEQRRIKYVNAEFTRMTGYNREEVLGRNPNLLKSGETPAEVYAALWATIRAGRTWRGELVNKRKDGSKYCVFAVIAPIFSRADDIQSFVALQVDITERQQLINDLHVARQRAEASNQAKTTFLANMSHELRTPLNAIIGFSQMLTNEVFGKLGNDKYRDYAEHIAESGQFLLNLVNDILDVSRVELGHLTLHEEKIDVRSLIAATLRLIGHLADKNYLSVTSHIDGHLPLLWGDERLVRQMLTNLVVNAVKFTGARGTVVVSARIVEDGGIQLSVKDSGVGIAPEDIPRVLQPFRQAEKQSAIKKKEGVGLGLTLAQGFARVHGAAFEIESSVGQGTEITIRFPPERSVR